jgi:hypothetical protein
MTEHQDGAGGSEPTPDWIRQGPQTAETTPARAKRRRLPLFWPMLILAAALAGLIVAAPSWVSLLPWAAPGSDQTATALAGIDQRLGELAQRQTALEDRLTRLEQHPANSAQTAQQQEQAAALQQLADRVGALEQRPAASGDAAQLAPVAESVGKLSQSEAELGARIDKLEARGAAAADSRGDEALLLALGQLRAALDSGRPFGAELAAVRALAQHRPELRQPLEALAGAAAAGIPATAALAQRFTQEVAPALLRVAEPPESDSLRDRILAKLRSLVVVHRIGNASDPLESAVERAEAALGRNDLAGAAKALEALPPHAASPAADWLAAAHQRLAATDTLDRLTTAVTAQLAPAAAER